MIAFAFLALVVVSVIADVLALAWHYARDERKTWRMVVLGCALEVVNAAPLVTTIMVGELWPIAAGVLGSAIGTVIGARRAPVLIQRSATLPGSTRAAE